MARTFSHRCSHAKLTALEKGRELSAYAAGERRGPGPALVVSSVRLDLRNGSWDFADVNAFVEKKWGFFGKGEKLVVEERES